MKRTSVEMASSGSIASRWSLCSAVRMPIPVCAGFGIRTAEHVNRMQGHVDGVVVGSALVEVLEKGEDPAAFLRSLRPS